MIHLKELKNKGEIEAYIAERIEQRIAYEVGEGASLAIGEYIKRILAIAIEEAILVMSGSDYAEFEEPRSKE